MKKKAILFTVFFLILISSSIILYNQKCSFSTGKGVINGNSLSPLLESSDEVKILFGYYSCHKVKKEDLVVLNISGYDYPLIKIAKGVPGDSFDLKKAEGGYNILINGSIVLNSENKPYLISESKYNLLSLYQEDYNGVIPDKAYLFLGNITTGSLDSTMLGLINKDNILGKVEY